MKNLNLLILSGIIILAIFLRLYRIDSVPPSASLDEVSLGWNAYSIMQTGKDEYAELFPLVLRAYDDWRPALYAYLIIPFIKIFDLDILAVRLPSVILSVLTILATYFLVREFFKKENLALLSSLFLAISPWHIYMSRLGHEVNLGLSAMIFAVLFFVRKRIYLSAIFFVISAVSYQTEKIFIPVLLFGIFLIYKDELLKAKKKIIIAILFSVLLLAPFIKATLVPNALIRFTATNVFEANKERFAQQARLLEEAVSESDVLGQLFYNRRTLAAQIFTEGYLSHFNPVWLFTNPSQDRHKVPGLGLLYIWTLPFITIGIYILVRRNYDPKVKKLIFLWFLSAPLSASITTDAPHALRSLVFLPTWEIFTSLGIISTFNFLKDKNSKNVSIGAFILIVILSLAYLYKQYFFVFPTTQSESFQYPLSKAIPFVLENQDSYKKVIFSNNNHLYQSYMFFLFYSKYDPKLYQKQGGTISGGFNETHDFGKFEFRPIDIQKEEFENLYIENVSDFPEGNFETLKIIKNLDGEETIKIITK